MACDGLCMYRYHHIGINIYSFVFLFYSIYSPVYAPPTNRWYFYFIIIYWWSVSFDIGMEWRSAMRSSSRVTSEIRRKKIWNEWWTCAFQREHEIQYIKYSCQYSIHDSQCNSWMSVGNAYCCCCCRMEKKKFNERLCTEHNHCNCIYASHRSINMHSVDFSLSPKDVRFFYFSCIWTSTELNGCVFFSLGSRLPYFTEALPHNWFSFFVSRSLQSFLRYSLDAIKFDWTNQNERNKNRRIFFCCI